MQSRQRFVHVKSTKNVFHGRNCIKQKTVGLNKWGEKPAGIKIRADLCSMSKGTSSAATGAEDEHDLKKTDWKQHRSQYPTLIRLISRAWNQDVTACSVVISKCIWATSPNGCVIKTKTGSILTDFFCHVHFEPGRQPVD